MGLDMYLHKKTYVRNWDFMTPEEKNIITIKKGGVERTDIKPERISEITENVGQWRKFNALHNWFVQNLADGVDDCKELYVERKALEILLDTLKKVKRILNKAEKKSVSVHVGWKDGKEFYEDMDVYDISDKIEKLLPTTSGFFFGGTEYDEYYYEEVCSTIKLFTELLKEEGGGDFYYQASW
jgi:hypothetical protein